MLVAPSMSTDPKVYVVIPTNPIIKGGGGGDPVDRFGKATIPSAA